MKEFKPEAAERKMLRQGNVMGKKIMKDTHAVHVRRSGLNLHQSYLFLPIATVAPLDPFLLNHHL